MCKHCRWPRGHTVFVNIFAKMKKFAKLFSPVHMGSRSNLSSKTKKLSKISWHCPFKVKCHAIFDCFSAPTHFFGNCILFLAVMNENWSKRISWQTTFSSHCIYELQVLWCFTILVIYALSYGKTSRKNDCNLSKNPKHWCCCLEWGFNIQHYCIVNFSRAKKPPFGNFLIDAESLKVFSLPG